jgi:hypothetical protein
MSRHAKLMRRDLKKVIKGKMMAHDRFRIRRPLKKVQNRRALRQKRMEA